MAKQSDSFVPIGGETSGYQLVSSEEWNDYQNKFKKQKQVQDWTLNLIILVVIVCFLAFVTFIIDAWKSHGDTLTEYNKTIEQLKTDNSNLKLKNLEDRIKYLEDRYSDQQQNSQAHKSISFKH